MARKRHFKNQLLSARVSWHQPRLLITHSKSVRYHVVKACQHCGLDSIRDACNILYIPVLEREGGGDEATKSLELLP